LKTSTLQSNRVASSSPTSLICSMNAPLGFIMTIHLPCGVADIVVVAAAAASVVAWEWE
jgi:hypothetical protein